MAAQEVDMDEEQVPTPSKHQGWWGPSTVLVLCTESWNPSDMQGTPNTGSPGPSFPAPSQGRGQGGAPRSAEPHQTGHGPETTATAPLLPTYVPAPSSSQCPLSCISLQSLSPGLSCDQQGLSSVSLQSSYRKHCGLAGPA